MRPSAKRVAGRFRNRGLSKPRWYREVVDLAVEFQKDMSKALGPDWEERGLHQPWSSHEIRVRMKYVPSASSFDYSVSVVFGQEGLTVRFVRGVPPEVEAEARKALVPLIRVYASRVKKAVG